MRFHQKPQSDSGLNIQEYCMNVVKNSAVQGWDSSSRNSLKTQSPSIFVLRCTELPSSRTSRGPRRPLELQPESLLHLRQRKRKSGRSQQSTSGGVCSLQAVFLEFPQFISTGTSLATAQSREHSSYKRMMGNVVFNRTHSYSE